MSPKVIISIAGIAGLVAVAIALIVTGEKVTLQEVVGAIVALCGAIAIAVKSFKK